MLKSLKTLTCSFLAVAIVMTVSTVCSNRLKAEPLSLDKLTAPEDKKEEIPELKEALARLRARDVKGAKRILEKAIEAHPKLPPAEVILAQFYAAGRNSRGVRHWLQQGVVNHPNSPDAYVMLGQMDAKSGLTIEAWLLLEKANTLLAADTKLDADRKKNLKAVILGQLAQLAMLRKNWEEAKAHLQPLLDQQPDSAGALQLMAQVLFEEGKADLALEKLHAAKAVAESKDKKFLTPQAVLAQWYEKAEDRENAIKLMTEALTIAPNDFNTRMAAAQWAFMIQNFKQAKVQAEAALQIDSESLPALLMAGNIAIFQKDYKTAEKYLDKALKADPLSFSASNNLALALCEQDDPKKLRRAQGLAQRNSNSKTYANEPEAFSTLGRVLYKSERLQEAEQALRKSVSLGKAVSPDTAYYMAVIYADIDKKDDAKKLLQNALKAKGLFAQRAEAEALLQRLSQ